VFRSEKLKLEVDSALRGSVAAGLARTLTQPTALHDPAGVGVMHRARPSVIRNANNVQNSNKGMKEAR
jgi:hypothetical protein